jgi:hypothetical protein
MYFFVLTQSTAWEYLFHLYGAKGEQKAITVDDKVRVAGILFQEDESRSEQHKQWKERSVGWIAQYAGQMASLYLGVVLMWDAQFGYIFHARKDPMPTDCMIDDNNVGGGGGGDDDGGMVSNNHFRTPRVGTATGRMQGSSSRKDIDAVLKEMQVGKESLQSTQNEMLQMMKAATTAGTTTTGDGGSASFVSKIKDTLNVLKECKSDLADLKKRKKRLARNDVMDGDGKMQRVTTDIKKKRRLISTLEETLDAQQEQLRAVTKSEAATAKGNRKDDDDDDYLDAGDDSSQDDDSGDDDADDGSE